MEHPVYVSFLYQEINIQRKLFIWIVPNCKKNYEREIDKINRKFPYYIYEPHFSRRGAR